MPLSQPLSLPLLVLAVSSLAHADRRQRELAELKATAEEELVTAFTRDDDPLERWKAWVAYEQVTRRIWAHNESRRPRKELYGAPTAWTIEHEPAQVASLDLRHEAAMRLRDDLARGLVEASRAERFASAAALGNAWLAFNGHTPPDDERCLEDVLAAEATDMDSLALRAIAEHALRLPVSRVTLLSGESELVVRSSAYADWAGLRVCEVEAWAALASATGARFTDIQVVVRDTRTVTTEEVERKRTENPAWQEWVAAREPVLAEAAALREEIEDLEECTYSSGYTPGTETRTEVVERGDGVYNPTFGISAPTHEIVTRTPGQWSAAWICQAPTSTTEELHRYRAAKARLEKVERQAASFGYEPPRYQYWERTTETSREVTDYGLVVTSGERVEEVPFKGTPTANQAVLQSRRMVLGAGGDAWIRALPRDQNREFALHMYAWAGSPRVSHDFFPMWDADGLDLSQWVDDYPARRAAGFREWTGDCDAPSTLSGKQRKRCRQVEQGAFAPERRLR